jgi:hypothetical protein
MYSPPTNTLELLINLKEAFDRGLVFGDEFYTDDSLRNFSGATKAAWLDDLPDQKRVLLSGFDSIARPVAYRGNVLPNIQFQISKSRTPCGGTRASARLSLVEAPCDLRFDNIERLFGTCHEYLPKKVPNPHKKFRRPTHPLGNKRIRYVSSVDELSLSAIFELGADGRFNNCLISAEIR